MKSVAAVKSTEELAMKSFNITRHEVRETACQNPAVQFHENNQNTSAESSELKQIESIWISSERVQAIPQSAYDWRCAIEIF